MAEDRIDLDTLMRRAKEQERQYAWGAAGALRSNALELIAEGDVMKKGVLKESLGCSIHKYAFQARTPEEFARRIGDSLEVYGIAEKDFDGSSEPTAVARAERCRAMSDYLRFWLEPDVVEKMKHVNSAWNHAKMALESFLTMGDYAQLGKTCSDTFLAAVLSYDFEPGVTERTTTLSDLTRYVSEAAEHGVESRQLAENLVQLAGCLEVSMVFLPHTVAQLKDTINRSHAAWLKACEVDEEAAVLERTKADLLSGLDWSTCGSSTRDSGRTRRP